ncbi:hypothetical protein LPJ62_001293 [Coemansia sp. RSA 2167]|nr:hypothetical protein LPJ62_001293 [Coemansia sp. RSA 2167]KAJ2127142.1 hypothetical protein GGH17_004816 [Coemansia sp. RSA 788]KAJ2153889.1 hypothetical protein J3F82_001637 [Coemansia sp. RSA 637]KAJ2166072.1 hypothetical protein GGH15_002980 [Coemansia sp. RSA 562]KAJ2173393.1 hypothetical protein GGH16_001860 [Coemansia sp. RSA 560]KAJ2182034.1 hypothetical protein GGF45_001141 [Coemansia sp. RSA 551]KAJ2185086.1 hypothetical protein EV181_004044 [Coemansia sp. RSA 532]KAJ2220170.1 hy
MKIHCISILSRHGTPIYLRNYTCEDDVKYHYLAHTSLDIIDTRLSQPTSYLGHLQTVGDLSVYGYITNTNVKIIVISSATTDTPTVRSSHMRRVCECVHAAYVALLCNPFNERREEDKIHSDRFDMVVEKLGQVE